MKTCTKCGKEKTLGTLDEFDHRCFWCGNPYEVMEHIVALSNGGPHSKGNVVPACVPCNSKKYNKDPLVFYFERKKEEEL